MMVVRLSDELSGSGNGSAWARLRVKFKKKYPNEMDKLFASITKPEIVCGEKG